jgi:hypothetical protein
MIFIYCISFHVFLCRIGPFLVSLLLQHFIYILYVAIGLRTFSCTFSGLKPSIKNPWQRERYHIMILLKRGSTIGDLTLRLRQNLGAKTFVLIRVDLTSKTAPPPIFLDPIH